jgi:hypothetical protein
MQSKVFSSGEVKSFLTAEPKMEHASFSGWKYAGRIG